MQWWEIRVVFQAVGSVPCLDAVVWARRGGLKHLLVSDLAASSRLVFIGSSRITQDRSLEANFVLFFSPERLYEYEARVLKAATTYDAAVVERYGWRELLWPRRSGFTVRGAE